MVTREDRPATTKKLFINMLPTFRIEAAGLSDIGRTRPNNEDYLGYDLDQSLFVVCDGMGGMAAGEVASRTAVELTLKAYEEEGQENIRQEERLRRSIASANEGVWKLAQQTRSLRGMGTTLVAACIYRSTLVVGHVGDSRIYLLRKNECTQITEDHSFASEHRRLKGVGLSEHLTVRLQQVITRAIGVAETVESDLLSMPLEPGDIIILATDGLTRYASPEELASRIQASSSLEIACRSLISIAHDRGAEDNTTCLLVRVS